MDISHNHDHSLESSDSHRGQVSMLRIGIALFGAPVAWLAQFSLSEPLAAHACYPYLEPVPAPVWEELPVMLVVISIACFAAALLSVFVAWTSWQQSERKQPGDEESIIAAGGNRNRFLIKLGVMSSFIFFVAIIFNICAILLVSPCGSWLQ